MLPYFLVIYVDQTGDYRRLEYGAFTTFCKDDKQLPEKELESGIRVRVNERKARQLLKVDILAPAPEKVHWHNKRVQAVRGTVASVSLHHHRGGPSVIFWQPNGYLAYSLHRGAVVYLGKTKVGLDKIQKGMPVELVVDKGAAPKALLAAKAGEKLETGWFYKDNKLEPLPSGQSPRDGEKTDNKPAKTN